MSRLFTWGARKGEEPVSSPSSPRIVESLSNSRALPRFLSSLATHPSPVLLDLGPVVGSNISFFGDRLSCKMLIEDLHEDISTAASSGTTDALGQVLAERIRSAVPGPVHGILCWDVFDYLDRAAARTLGASLREVLAPKGMLHGLFASVPGQIEYRSRYIVQSETAFKCRQEPVTPVKRHALQGGEIARLFEGLAVVESVLLQNKTREALFRKS